VCEQVGQCCPQLFPGVMSSECFWEVVASSERSYGGFLRMRFSGELHGDEMRVEVLELRSEIAEGLSEAGAGRLRGRKQKHVRGTSVVG
jgi:hypothetical protein